MRIVSLIVLACLPAATGCAVLIAGAGADPESLAGAGGIRHSGTPLLQYEPGDQIAFRTHRKIAEPDRAARILDRDLVTPLGIAELVQTPYELFRVTRTLLLGQEVVVRSDRLGQVERVTIDGEVVYQRKYGPRDLGPEPSECGPPHSVP